MSDFWSARSRISHWNRNGECGMENWELRMGNREWLPQICFESALFSASLLNTYTGCILHPDKLSRIYSVHTTRRVPKFFETLLGLGKVSELSLHSTFATFLWDVAWSRQSKRAFFALNFRNIIKIQPLWCCCGIRNATGWRTDDRHSRVTSRRHIGQWRCPPHCAYRLVWGY